MKLFQFLRSETPHGRGVVVVISVVCWVVANTGWHGGRYGTSGPAARANSVALGGSSTFTSELGFQRGLVL